MDFLIIILVCIFITGVFLFLQQHLSLPKASCPLLKLKKSTALLPVHYAEDRIPCCSVAAHLNQQRPPRRRSNPPLP